MSDRIDSVDDVRDRLSDERIAMVTSIDEQGTLSARPLTIKRSTPPSTAAVTDSRPDLGDSGAIGV